MFDQLYANLKSLLFPGSDRPAIPMLDGPFRPDNRLEALAEIGAPIPACDDIAIDEGGTLYVSSGRDILRLWGEDWRERAVHARCDGDVGALACAGGALFAGVAGIGVIRFDDSRETARLSSVDGVPLHCPTAITILANGEVAITEGSSRHLPADWCRDLMERNSHGRVMIAAGDLGSARVIARDLAWPGGVAAAPDGAAIWVCEAWRHRILAYPQQGGTPRAVVPNLPGYPARLAAAPGGGYWLALFALRTQLVELVLDETRYRREMMATIDPELWIAPSLRATGGYLEPLQGGAIRKLGIIKPWAPARSYGLVVRLSGEGEALESLHSRVGGRHHGVTAARVAGDQLLIAAKGGGCLLQHRLGEPS